LALETRCTMHAVDVQVAALQVAAQNANRLQANVKFYELDILKERLDEKFDLIVSNPPYISQQEKHLMKPNVLNYEPHTALFALGDDPLLFYRAITRQAQHALNRGGSLWFEINEHYAKEICEIMILNGFENVAVVKDWNGKKRVVWGNR